MKNTILTILVSLFFSANIFASQVKVLHFTVDISQSYGEIFVTYDELGDIDHFTWKITHPQDEGSPTEQDEFTVKDVQNGTVFKSGLPKKFVKVWSDNFSAHNGGIIQVRVPGNILTGKHTFEQFEMDRMGDAWEFNYSNQVNVKKVELKLKRFLGLPIGITGFEIVE